MREHGASMRDQYSSSTKPSRSVAFSWMSRFSGALQSTSPPQAARRSAARSIDWARSTQSMAAPPLGVVGRCPSPYSVPGDGSTGGGAGALEAPAVGRPEHHALHAGVFLAPRIMCGQRRVELAPAEEAGGDDSRSEALHDLPPQRQRVYKARLSAHRDLVLDGHGHVAESGAGDEVGEASAEPVVAPAGLPPGEEGVVEALHGGGRRRLP